MNIQKYQYKKLFVDDHYWNLSVNDIFFLSLSNTKFTFTYIEYISGACYQTNFCKIIYHFIYLYAELSIYSYYTVFKLHMKNKVSDSKTSVHVEYK